MDKVNETITGGRWGRGRPPDPVVHARNGISGMVQPVHLPPPGVAGTVDDVLVALIVVCAALHAEPAEVPAARARHGTAGFEVDEGTPAVGAAQRQRRFLQT